jgi:transcriptional regulator with XRE-family HTH domain
MMNGYGGRLSRAMKKKGIKQIELANKLKITRTAISKIVHGSQYLDFDLAIKACEILDISLDWLAYGDNSDRKPIYYRIPDRQRIEYLLSILQEAEYPLVIVALEELIEIRLGGKKEDN